MSVRAWEIVECARCGHIWDDLNPEDEVCACVDKYGERSVYIISAGATNVPMHEIVGKAHHKTP